MPNKKVEIQPGTKFGRLTVLYESPIRKNKGIVYHCRCDCGNEKDVRSMSLRNGDTKSCGCLARELSSKRNKNKNIHDLTNQKFGLLTAIKQTDERKQGSVVWECKCDCGNIVKVSSKNLVHGDTKSCGCLKSKGELLIAQILKDNNIPFIQEYSFNDLKSEKGWPLRYDFFVNNQYLIEFDGEQHFSNTKLFAHDNFDYRIQNDKLKTDYAFKHNIPLIRIPYTKINSLTIKDLIPSFTALLR